MSDVGYVGRQTAFTTGSDYETHELLIESILNGRASVTLGLVTAAQPGGAGQAGTVTIQPMVNQVDGLGNATPHGTISNVPYMRLQAGANGVIVDPVVGDIGIVVFASSDISSVKVNRAVSNPGSARRGSWSDALYIGGVLGGALTQYVQFLSGGGINIVSTGTVTVTAPNVILSANVKVTGTFESDGVTTLGGAGGNPVETTAGAATKVKAT